MRAHPLRLSSSLLLLMLWLPTSASLAHQESRLVSQAIEDFLKIQTQGLPGQISYAVTPLDPRNKLTPCKDFSVSLIPGGRLWGRTSVMVSCQNENGWKIHVPVRISVHSDYLVTARALSQGQVINENDLTHNHGDLTTLPDGLLTDARQAIGRSTVQSLPAGRPLRGDLLRQAAAVHQGQNVKVRATGPGFQVTGGDGRALNTAADGQVVQVRMANGHIVNGIGRAGGIVEVSY